MHGHDHNLGDELRPEIAEDRLERRISDGRQGLPTPTAAAARLAVGATRVCASRLALVPLDARAGRRLGPCLLRLVRLIHWIAIERCRRHLPLGGRCSRFGRELRRGLQASLLVIVLELLRRAERPQRGGQITLQIAILLRSAGGGSGVRQLEQCEQRRAKRLLGVGELVPRKRAKRRVLREQPPLQVAEGAREPGKQRRPSLAQ